MVFTLSRVRQLKADQMFDVGDAQILRSALDHVALDVKQDVSLTARLIHLCVFTNYRYLFCRDSYQDFPLMKTQQT